MSLCSNAQLQLATSLEKRGGKKEIIDISLEEKRDGNHMERENNPPSSVLLFRETILRQTILDFFLYFSRLQFLLPGEFVSVQSVSSTLQ